MTVSAAEVDFWRQTDILSPTEASKTKITVIGAGGIGSPTIMALSKMGIGEIDVYDFDTVESHNIPNQMFLPEDIGRNKAEIMAEYATKLGVKAEAFPQRYRKQSLSGIVVIAVDSMRARKEAWENCKYNPNVRLFVEARMGAEVGMVYAIYPMSVREVDFYESTLYDDDEAAELPCTARAIIYNVFGIAAFIGSIISKWIMQKDYPREIKFDYVNHLVFTKQSI